MHKVTINTERGVKVYEGKVFDLGNEVVVRDARTNKILAVAWKEFVVSVEVTL